MINSTTLHERVQTYTDNCKRLHTKPTYTGLAKQLEVSGQTIGNVNKGMYNNKPYGKEPHATRCIDNKDFDIIRDVFSKM